MESLIITIEIAINFVVKSIKTKVSKFKTDKLVNSISKQFKGLKSASFVGIKAYTSSTSGEVANHVVCANFSYKNAVKRDLKKLQKLTDKDKEKLSEKTGFTLDLINQAVQKLTDSFLNNLNPETQSNQSKAQQELYQKINGSMKIHKETKQIYIYALAISKEILKHGEYKTVNSRPLTLAQNAVKKELDFTTSKYRQFIVNAENLTGVNVDGEKFVLI